MYSRRLYTPCEGATLHQKEYTLSFKLSFAIVIFIAWPRTDLPSEGATVPSWIHCNINLFRCVVIWSTIIAEKRIADYKSLYQIKFTIFHQVGSLILLEVYECLFSFGIRLESPAHIPADWIYRRQRITIFEYLNCLILELYL